MYSLRALVLFAFVTVGCGDDGPPPPSPSQKVACDTLDYCRISSSGFSCDGDKATRCAQCINASSCAAILDGLCRPDCPGVSFKAK
jgi:hypothetical protein